jgi:DNA-binding FadR family transcriptional regulator
MAAAVSRGKIVGEGMFRPLKKQRFSDQIAELIHKKILEDNLKIGTSLPSEKEMAAEFQVSRSVVREALRILEISGLVNIKKGPTGGIFVSNVYHKPIKRSLNNLITSGEVTLEHLFDARMLIEPHIAGQAARQAKSKDLKKFRALFEDSSSHLDDPVRLKQNNLKFHLMLARASGNPVLSIMLESVFELLVERIQGFLDHATETRFFEIHKDIFKVIEEGRPEEAERLIKEDISEIMEKIIKSASSQPPRR